MATHLQVVNGHASGFGATTRRDAWWLGPLVTVAVLMAFVIYVTWCGLQGDHFTWGPYLSPFYSPVLFAAPSGEGLAHAWFGAWPAWWPSFLPASPAVLIVPFPALVRFTCYYYRKAYYRGFAGSPPGCAVGPLASNRRYDGETSFLTFQNLHRYGLYLALPYIPILYWDAFVACSYKGELGFGVGTIIMFINATLLGGFLFGCNSFRHLIGGHDDCMSCGRNTTKFSLWKKSTWLNERHMMFAWTSLVWVLLTDIYIRLVSHGVITDFNTWSL